MGSPTHFDVFLCSHMHSILDKIIICIHFTMFPPWAMVRNNFLNFCNHKILQIHEEKKAFKLLTTNTNHVHSKHQFDELLYYCFLCMDTNVHHLCHCYHVICEEKDDEEVKKCWHHVLLLLLVHLFVKEKTH
jgi:hypothetical protein